MGRENNIKGIEEILEKYLKLLYAYRLYEDRNVPYNEYVKIYKSIEADGILYCDKNDKWVIRKWLMGNTTQLMVTDATIANDTIIKNRYGKR